MRITEEIVAVMRQAGTGVHGARIRGLIVVLWRLGFESAKPWIWPRRSSIRGAAPSLVRRGKGGKRRESGMDDWGWEQIHLQGIDNTEVISTIHARRAPTMPASAGLLM